MQLYLGSLEYLLLSFIGSLLELKQDQLRTKPKHERIKFIKMETAASVL